MKTLRSILSQHHTDKDTVHSYGDVYERLFADFRTTASKVVEIGIDCGGSLRAWAEYFTSAAIVGVDIRNVEGVATSRISTYCFDQSDEEQIVSHFGCEELDIVIDDGSHRISDQLLSAHYFMPKLKMGGLYIIEDIQSFSMLSYFRAFANAEFIDLRQSKGRYDDLMVLIRK